MKTIYSSLYSHFFASLETKWDLAVQRQPREGETAEQIAAEVAGVNRNFQNEDEDGEVEVVVDEDAIFDLEIQIGEMEDGEIPNPDAQGEVPNGNGDANADAPAGQPHVHNHARRRPDWTDNILPHVTHVTGTTIMTSILFPALSATIGNILMYTLPLSWTLPARVTGSRGLLKEKWGRSLVGGCLLVVLKDMVLLYCKWKKAKDFGKREVLDYVRPQTKEGSLWERMMGRGGA